MVPRGVTTSDSSDQGLMGPPSPLHPRRILKTYEFPFAMFWTAGKKPPVNPARDITCTVSVGSRSRPGAVSSS